MFRYLLLVVTPALVTGCCFPNQWESIQHVVYASKEPNYSPRLYEIIQTTSMDKMKNMAVYHQNFTNGNFQTVYQDYSKGVQYVLTGAGAFCENLTYSFTEQIENECVPVCAPLPVPGMEGLEYQTFGEMSVTDTIFDNATVFERSFIGAGAEKIATTLYGYKTMGTTVHVSVMDDGCIPLTFETKGPSRGGGVAKMTILVFGVTTGIADPSIFTVPSICMTA